MLCVSIHCELFLRCREELVPNLKQKVGVLEADGQRSIFVPFPTISKANTFIAHERLAVLLAVNPRDEERRTVLNKEKVTIAKALKQLEALTCDGS